MEIFDEVKRVPFTDIIIAFHAQDIPRSKKVACPFHPEHDPSLHVYNDGFKCFGCGEAGDGISFVSKLYDLKPIDAAKTIAERFNIPVKDAKDMTTQEKRELVKAKKQWGQEKELSEAFKQWEREAVTRVSLLAEKTRLVFQRKGVYVDKNLLTLIHMLPLFDHWLEILQGNSLEEKDMLYNNEEFQRWCFPCQSSNTQTT